MFWDFFIWCILTKTSSEVFFNWSAVKEIFPAYHLEYVFISFRVANMNLEMVWSEVQVCVC